MVWNTFWESCFGPQPKRTSSVVRHVCLLIVWKLQIEIACQRLIWRLRNHTEASTPIRHMRQRAFPASLSPPRAPTLSGGARSNFAKRIHAIIINPSRSEDSDVLIDATCIVIKIKGPIDCVCGSPSVRPGGERLLGIGQIVKIFYNFKIFKCLIVIS